MEPFTFSFSMMNFGLLNVLVGMGRNIRVVPAYNCLLYLALDLLSRCHALIDMPRFTLGPVHTTFLL